MVKKLDDNAHPPAIDHLGWRLWRAAEAWKQAFEDGMAERGHPWFAEARGGLFRHIGAAGILQSDLAARLATTKQAVQQLVDQLETEGLVERVAEERDRRNKRVMLTRKGRAAMHEANDVKRAVEAAYRRKLGADTLAELNRILDLMAP